MVHVMRQKQDFGKQVGEGLSSVLLPRWQEQRKYELNKSRLEEALSSFDKLKSDPDADEVDLAKAYMRSRVAAGESGKGMENVFDALTKRLQLKREKESMGGAGKGGEADEETEKDLIDRQRNRKPLKPYEKKELPGFLEKKNKAKETAKFHPSVQPGTEAPGNLYQPSTAGIKAPRLNPDEQKQEASRISQIERIPYNDAMLRVEKADKAAELYNTQIDLDTDKRIEKAANAGKVALTEFGNVFPKSTNEEKAIAKRIGEEEAANRESPAEIDRAIAVKMNNFANTVESIKKQPDAPRGVNKFTRKLMQKYVPMDKYQAHLHSLLKPLHEEGLYDRERSLLEGKNLWPEEREETIFPEYKNPNDIVKSIPKAKTENVYAGSLPSSGPVYNKNYLPEAYGTLRENIKHVFKDDRNTNVILLRRNYEPFGYDWKIYGETLADLINSGEIELNPDQQKQATKLIEPPLDALGTILHDIGWRGR